MMIGAIGNRRREARTLGSRIIGNEIYKYWGLRRLGNILVARCVAPDFWMWNSIGFDPPGVGANPAFGRVVIASCS